MTRLGGTVHPRMKRARRRSRSRAIRTLRPDATRSHSARLHSLTMRYIRAEQA